jgi:hypothetical protein
MNNEQHLIRVVFENVSISDKHLIRRIAMNTSDEKCAESLCPEEDAYFAASNRVQG